MLIKSRAPRSAGLHETSTGPGNRLRRITKTTRSGYFVTKMAVVLTAGSLLVSAAANAGGEKDWDKILKTGNTELAQGNTEKAIAFFHEKCLKYPLSGACHTGLGKSLKRLGKIAESKEELKKATELDPSYAPGFYELGSILEGDNEWAGAARAFEKYLELSPDAGQRQAISDRIRSCKDHM